MVALAMFQRIAYMLYKRIAEFQISLFKSLGARVLKNYSEPEEKFLLFKNAATIMRELS